MATDCEEVNGIKFFRRVSEVSGDTTLNGSLEGRDVDDNFYYLREMLIDSAYTAEYTLENESGGTETTAELVLVRVNNEKEIHIDMTPFLPNIVEYTIETEYDKTKGEISLHLMKDDVEVKSCTFNGLITDKNFKYELDNVLEDNVITKVLSDNTIEGFGTKDQVLGLSPLFYTGQYSPAISYIDLTKSDSSLPTGNTKGDRYIVREYDYTYGYLYPYKAIKVIQKDLDAESLKRFNEYSAKTSTLGWRIPTTDDWNDMLNGVELDYAKSIGCVDASGNSTLSSADTYIHTSDKYYGYALGYIAGRLLKSKSYYSGSTSNEGWQVDKDHIGTDMYGFKAEPAGWADINYILADHGAKASFWTSAEGEGLTNPYSKLHQYDYMEFFRDGNAKAKTFINGGATSGDAANLVVNELTTQDSFRSIRFVKEFDGDNFIDREEILGGRFSTILLPSLTSETGYKVWTIENLNIDSKDKDGNYKYSSVKTINDKLTDESKFAYFYEAYYNGNSWEFQKMNEGDCVILHNAINSGENDYDEYKIISGSLVDVTIDGTVLYEKITDLNIKIGNVQSDSVKSDMDIWVSLNELSGQVMSTPNDIKTLSANLDSFSADVIAYETKTDKHLDNIESSAITFSGDIMYLSGRVSANTSAINSAKTDIDSLSATIDSFSAHMTTCCDEMSGYVKSLSADVNVYKEESSLVHTLSARVECMDNIVVKNELNINKNSADIISLSSKVDTMDSKMNTFINETTAGIQTVTDNIATINQNLGEFDTVNNKIQDTNTSIGKINTILDYLSINSASIQEVRAISSYSDSISAKLDVLSAKVDTSFSDIRTYIDNQDNGLLNKINTNSANIITLSGTVKCLSDNNVLLTNNVNTLSADLKSVSAIVNENVTNIQTISSTTIPNMDKKIDDDFTSLSSLVNQNTADIAINKTNIASVTSFANILEQTVNENTTQIASNTADISKLSGAVFTDVSGYIDTLSATVKTLDSNTTKSIDDINAKLTDNTVKINSNTDSITLIGNRVDKLENDTSVSALQTKIDVISGSLVSSSALLASNIAANSADIITLSGYVISNSANINSLSAKVTNYAASVDGNSLYKVDVNGGAYVANEENGRIVKTTCGTEVYLQVNTDDSFFKPITGTGDTDVNLDTTMPNAIGSLSAGTKVSDIANSDVSTLLQNILFPIIYPTVYQKPSITIENVQNWFPLKEGYTESGYTIDNNGNFVMLLGKYFNPTRETGWTYSDSLAYIEADDNKYLDDKYYKQKVTNGFGSVGPTMVLEAQFYGNTNGNNVDSTASTLNDIVSDDTASLMNIGSATVHATGAFVANPNGLYASRGDAKTDIQGYVINDNKTKTYYSDLFNPFIYKDAILSNYLDAYISEPIFIVHTTTANTNMDVVIDTTTSDKNLVFDGWKDDDENGVGPIVDLEKWGKMSCSFNINNGLKFASFAILSPIPLTAIYMGAISGNINTGYNILEADLTYADIVKDDDSQKAWIAKNVPNVFVPGYDVNISFADWRNASNVVKAKYYSYVWVGGSQIPTSFKAITSTPE